MKIVITSDSVCDLSQEQLKKNKINLLPLGINLGDDLFMDGVEVNSEKIFEYYNQNKKLPKTSAINEFQYNEFFEKNLKGTDALIHFTISKELSSCYNNAISAQKNFENVFVINSETLSSGVGLLVLYACALRDKGKTAQEIVDMVEAKKPQVQASFVIERLDYLHKGGRCSALQLLGANILKIRPSIKVSNGKMGMHKKYRGKIRDCVKDYILDTLKENPNYEPDLCFVTYSSATPEMLEVAEQTLKQNATFKEIVFTTASATITSHCGENTLGILYFINPFDSTGKDVGNLDD